MSLKWKHNKGLSHQEVSPFDFYLIGFGQFILLSIVHSKDYMQELKHFKTCKYYNVFHLLHTQLV